MAKISIVVPVYNAEKYLAACIDSVICQTFQDWELVLVDDGSTDGSYQIASGYAQRDERIKVVNNGHHGVSKARNTGIAMTTGMYIMFIDSDDTVTADACQTLLDSAGNSDLTFGTYQTVYTGSGMVIDHPVPLFQGDMNQFCQKIDVYLGEAIIQGPCWKLFKRELIQQNGLIFPEDIDFGEDACFVYTYMKYAKTVCVVNQVIYHYYVYGKSLNHGFRPDKFRINLMLSQLLTDFLRHHGVANCDLKYNEMVRNAFSAYLNDCALCDNDREAIRAIRMAISCSQTKVAYRDGQGLSKKQKMIRILLINDRVTGLLFISKCNYLLSKCRIAVCRAKRA